MPQWEDVFPDIILQWISQYGYTAIFVLLMFGIVGLPVPDETLLTFTGYLVFRGHLHFAPALAAAFGGSVCGISLSYTLGRTFGFRLVHRYGRFLHVTDANLARVHAWFERAGRWTLTFGYFVPGVRHLTAYVAGTSKLGVGPFVTFAYAGGLLWSTGFISLGYFLGERWSSVIRELHHVVIAAVLAAGVLLLLYLFWKRRS